VSTRADAEALWGRDAVARALAHPEPVQVTARLLAEIRGRLASDQELAEWGRALDAPTFAAVVRVVAGEARRDLLHAARAADEEETY